MVERSPGMEMLVERLAERSPAVEMLAERQAEQLLAAIFPFAAAVPRSGERFGDLDEREWQFHWSRQS